MSNSFTIGWVRLSLAVALASGTGALQPTELLARGALRDPTRPPNISEFEQVKQHVSASSPYALTAILLAKGRRIAVINGEPVQAGDRVSNAKVTSILRDKVVLRAGGENLTLRLIPRSIEINEAVRQ